MNKKLIASLSALLLTGSFSNMLPKFIHTDKVSAATKSTTAVKATVKNKKYKDGVYKGSAKGYRGHGFDGTTTVSVTVKSDKITSVKIVSIGDTPEWYATPVEVIPGEIIKAQSTNIDVISGATFSSRGIINAVVAALKKAKV